MKKILKQSFLKAFLFSAAISVLPAALHSYSESGNGFYFGLNASKLFNGKDSTLSASFEEVSAKLGGMASSDRVFEGSLWYSDALHFLVDTKDDAGNVIYPTARPLSSYNIDFENGKSFGGVFGFSFYNNLFIEGEFALINSVGKVKEMQPEYLSNENLFVNSDAKAFFVNVGYNFFANKGPISPFAGAGIGMAKINNYGELRVGFGDNKDENGNYHELSSKSRINGYFETESKYQAAGNAKFGFSFATNSNVVALLSYKYTKVFGDIETEFNRSEQYQPSGKWAFRKAPESNDEYGVKWEELTGKLSEEELMVFTAKLSSDAREVFNSLNNEVELDSYSAHAVELSIRVPFS